MPPHPIGDTPGLNGNYAVAAVRRQLLVFMLVVVVPVIVAFMVVAVRNLTAI